MEVQIYHLQQGAREAKGIVVIIDVFRAFSTQCYLMHYGVKQILPVADIDSAYDIKKKYPDYILIGERGGKIQPGFDFGNSPHQISCADIKNKTIVHTTSNGVLGISNATGASRIIAGSLVNAAAIARYIKKTNPENVSLVCMGVNDSEQADEDVICAEYIKSLLLDEKYDLAAELEKLKTTTGARFFDPVNADWSPEEDFYLCTKADCYDFVLEAKRDNGVLYMERIEI
jgi:2-phosphosulfolactate phosphatase